MRISPFPLCAIKVPLLGNGKSPPSSLPSSLLTCLLCDRTETSLNWSEDTCTGMISFSCGGKVFPMVSSGGGGGGVVSSFLLIFWAVFR